MESKLLVAQIDVFNAPSVRMHINDRALSGYIVKL